MGLLKKKKKNIEASPLDVSTNVGVLSGNVKKKKKIKKEKPARVRTHNRNAKKERDSIFAPENKTLTVTPLKMSFWLRTLTKKQLNYMDLMKAPMRTRIKYARSRVITAIMFIIVGLLAGLLLHQPYFIYGGIVFGIFIFWQKGHALAGMYRQYQYNREMHFIIFFSLLSPMLIKVINGESLYRVLSQIVPRLDSKEDRQIIRQLMTDMNNNPGANEPFIECAKNFSNTSESIIMMTSVAQVERASDGLEVVRRLSDSASDALMKKIDEIMMFKTRKFFFTTTKITMSSLPLIFGIVIGMVVAEMTAMFSKIHF